MPREKTNELLELVDDGVLDARQVLLAALLWLSESDVAEMARANEFLMEEEEEEEEEEETEEEEAYEVGDDDLELVLGSGAQHTTRTDIDGHDRDGWYLPDGTWLGETVRSAAEALRG